jgi:hypothetical protein
MTASAISLTRSLEKPPTIVRLRTLRFNGTIPALLPNIEEGTVLILDSAPYYIMYRDGWRVAPREFGICHELTVRHDHVLETFAELIQAAVELKFDVFFELAVDHPEVVRKLGEPLDKPPLGAVRLYPGRSPNMLKVFMMKHNFYELELDIALPTTTREVRRRVMEHASKRCDFFIFGRRVVIFPILRFPYHAEQMVGQCLALAPFELPPYVLLEIIDWLPYVQDMSHWDKIKHLTAIRESIRRVWNRRADGHR